MQPYIGKVLTYRQSYTISKRPYIQNTLTHQSADMNNATRDPFHGPVTWNPYRTRPYVYAKATSTSTATSTTPCFSAAVTITTSNTLLRQEPAHHNISYLALVSTLLMELIDSGGIN